MKKAKLIALVLAVMCVLALSACGASFDPVAYVQGNFDAAFHGDITDEFVATLDDVDSVEDFEAEYNELIDATTDGFLTSMGIFDPSETLRADTRDMFITLMDSAKYEVSNEYVENEDGSYIVEVTVYPLLTYLDVCLDEDGAIEAAALEKVTADMSYDQIITVFLEEIIAAVNIAMENPEYGEGIVYEVEIFIDEDGYYNVDESAMEEIGAAILGA
ncbi:MAG: hypothetical protein IIY02_03740 [Firmicutes bacterium]|nr:hypothetical protein [Bacillota bacterium]